MYLNDFVQSDTLPQVARVFFPSIPRPSNEGIKCFTKYLIGRENVGEVRVPNLRITKICHMFKNVNPDKCGFHMYVGCIC